MLFPSNPLLAVVENHMVALDVQHPADDVAASFLHRLFHPVHAVIGDTRILAIEIHGHGKLFEIPVIDTHAFRTILQHHTALLERIGLQDLSKIFLVKFHGILVLVGSFAQLFYMVD